MMNDSIEFETPENVKVQYQLAGLGTRFTAWVTDQLLFIIAAAVLFLVLVFTVTEASEGFRRGFDEGYENGQQGGLYAFGLASLVIGLGNFFYYGLFELLMRGQTPGKRSLKIRVVKVDGFALDSVSILVRNIFRIIDHMPPMWLVPLFSRRQQRLGDMVAGTLLVRDGPAKDNDTLHVYLRRRIEAGSAPTFQFRGRLGRLGETDWRAAEDTLDRALRLGKDACARPLELLLPALATKLGVPPPDPGQEIAFLEDLLTAEYQRKDHRLG